MAIMAYNKRVSGDHNQANETASHNRFIINTGAGFTVFAIYAITLVTGAIIFMAIAFGELLKYAVVITIGALVITGWLWLVMFVRRSVSHTSTTVAIHRYRRDQAWLESRVAVREALYALYLDENDNLQFRDTKQITENRHYPAQIEAPKQADFTEIITTMSDKGSGAREIERWIKYQNSDRPKEELPSLRQIIKTLNTYRPGWQGSSKKVVDAEDYPVEE